MEIRFVTMDNKNSYRFDLSSFEGLEDPKLGSKLRKVLDVHGVAVISGVIEAKECEELVTQSVCRLCSHSEGLTEDPKTWIDSRLPYGARWGMYQSIVGHFSEAWQLRERLYPLFANLWQEKELITSVDGASIFPPKVTKGNDWAHVDQTTLESVKLSYQGQVVLTETTASFRCTPGSGRFHGEIMKLLDVTTDGTGVKEWCKFTPPQEEKVKKFLAERGVKEWQLPIHSPAGSVILWKSTTIHSSQRNERLPTEDEKKKPYSRWTGWRCTYYVCLRPKKHLSKRELTTLRKATTEGRITTHWSNKMFPKKPGSQYGDSKVESIRKLSENPDVLLKDVEMTPLLKKLTGVQEW